MKTLKVILATMVIFGMGAIACGLVVNQVQHSHTKASHQVAASSGANPSATDQTPHSLSEMKPRPPEVLSKHFLQKIDQDLDLTPEQHKEIQRIISEGQNQMRKVVQDSRLEIREALAPEQLLKFDELIKHQFHKSIFGTNSSLPLPSATKAQEP